MPPSTSRILVTGATGLTGGALLRRLSAKGIGVRALTRDPKRGAAIPGVEWVAGDLGKPESLAKPLEGIEKAMLISTSDPFMQDVQVAFIDAAVKAGVKHVVKLSGIMPDVDSPFRFARMHGNIEKHLERSGLKFTHLRPGEFMQSYFRQIVPISQKGVLPLPMADARIAGIDAEDVAEVMLQLLTQGGHEGKTYPLTGTEALTMAEVAAQLSKAIGKPVKYIDVPPEEARKARLAAGMPPPRADALDELFAERRKGGESKVYDTAQKVFGLKPITFAEFAQKHAAIFRGEQPPPAGF